MAKKEYRSMRGKIVDMELLAKRNELTPAIGNAKVNARGDELGPGGKIIRKREDIIKDYYDKNPNVARDETGRFKINNKKEEQKITEELTAHESEMLDDEWTEDDEGNFVKKR